MHAEKFDRLNDRISDLAPERRGGAEKIIDIMTSDRKQIAALYQEAGRLRPFEDSPSLQAALERLSCALADYVALTHFGVFKRIVEGEERRENICKVATTVYPKIESTTEEILDFVGNHDEWRAGHTAKRLTLEMRRLGRCLTRRVQLENQLLAAMVDDPPALLTG